MDGCKDISKILKSRINTLKNFLSIDNLIIFSEHRSDVELYLQMLEKDIIEGYNTSIYGQHLKNCCWLESTTTCGPDTCHCMHIEMNWITIERLMLKYLKSHFTEIDFSKQ